MKLKLKNKWKTKTKSKNKSKRKSHWSTVVAVNFMQKNSNLKKCSSWCYTSKNTEISIKKLSGSQVKVKFHKSQQVMWLSSPRSEAQAHVCRYVAPPGERYYNTMLQIFFIMECGIVHFPCAIRIFEVWALSSSPRLPLCQISFLLQPPLLS